MQERITVIPHTADLQLHIQAKTLPALFRLALIGMFQNAHPQAPNCIYRGPDLVCQKLPVCRKVHIQAPDKDLLLVDFLSHALYLSAVHHEVYLDVSIDEFSEQQTSATLHGTPITSFMHDIKAVTHHNLAIVQKDSMWHAHVVFDI